MNTDDDFDLLADPTPQAGEPWTAGEEFTVLGSVTLNVGQPFVDASSVCGRGDILTVTEKTLRFQSDLLALVDDEDRQRERWGEVRLRRGRHAVERWTRPGDAVWEIENAAARAVANALVDPAARREAHREIAERFGVRPTSNASNQYRDIASERRAAEDAEYRAQARQSIRSM